MSYHGFFATLLTVIKDFLVVDDRDEQNCYGVRNGVGDSRAHFCSFGVTILGYDFCPLLYLTSSRIEGRKATVYHF